MPDGQQVTIGADRFKAPEIMFNPQLCGASDDQHGMHKLVWETIMSSDENCRASLMDAIILSGGSTEFEGLPERLTKELQALSAKPEMINVSARKDRYYSVWLGGSTLTQLTSFASQWFTKAEYDDKGAKYIHTKCKS